MKIVLGHHWKSTAADPSLFMCLKCEGYRPLHEMLDPRVNKPGTVDRIEWYVNGELVLMDCEERCNYMLAESVLND